MEICRHFRTKHYALRLCIVQNLVNFVNFSCLFFLAPKCPNTPKLYTISAPYQKMVKQMVLTITLFFQ